jgi:diacylglycerol O-acyltransferase / wax synthase
MDAFDRARPLWELTLVEGVEDGGTALIVKVHHSLSDGVSGVRMPAVMADPKRKPRRFGAMPPAPPGETVDQLTPAAGAASRTAARRGLDGR